MSVHICLGSGAWRERLFVLDEGHAEKVRNPAGPAIAKFFVEAHGPKERFGGVEGDAGAVAGMQFRFRAAQELPGKSRAAPSGKHRHSPKMALARFEHLAGNGAADFAGRVDGDKDNHLRQTHLNYLRREDGIQKRGGRIEVAIVFERRSQALEDSGNVLARRFADPDSRKFSRHENPLFEAMENVRGEA
jgi:hypothetical protein